MLGRRSKENVPPMTGQAAACARVATKETGASPLRPLQSRDPNRMSHVAHQSAKPDVYPSQVPQTLRPPLWPPTLQNATSTASRAHTWRLASRHESGSVSRPEATTQWPVQQAPDDRARPAPRIPATGVAVFRSQSVRSYFQPPVPPSRQPSLAAGCPHASNRRSVSYMLAGDDLDAVLRKGLEAVKRRQAQAESELREMPDCDVLHRGTHARPLGDQPLQQLASSSYAHAVPECQSINAERRPEIRHACHHYAPHMLESQSAEIYVM